MSRVPRQAAYGVVIKLDVLSGSRFRNDIAAVLAASAALLGTLSAVGSFEQKWAADRFGKTELDALRLSFVTTACPTLEPTREKLNRVVLDHGARTVPGKR